MQVTAGVIYADGLILLARRAKGRSLAGFWEFPGGKVELGEDLIACLHRELQEEFAMQVEIQKELGRRIHRYDDKAIELICFICQMRTYPIRLVDHDDLCWVALGQLRQMKLAPADVPFIDLL